VGREEPYKEAETEQLCNVLRVVIKGAGSKDKGPQKVWVKLDQAASWKRERERERERDR